MKNIVPRFILENPIKFGFNTPLSQHFNSLESEACKIILSERSLARGIFEKEGLKNMIDNHINKSRNNSTILFRLLSVELWFRHFIDIKL
jgi:asparagine synthase (glutamine-hydrolysing)